MPQPSHSVPACAEEAAPVSADEFKRAMRRFAGVCTIVTSADSDLGREGWVGLTATAVASVTAAPPRLLVCINRSALAHRTILRSGVLGINVLSAANGTSFANRFGGGQCRAEDRFDEGEWITGVLGAPLLAESLVTFECRTKAIHSSGTHDIIIGDVIATGGTSSHIDPLIYFDGAFKTSLACN